MPPRAGDLHAGDVNYAAVQIAIAQLGSEQVVVVAFGISIVIPVNPVHLRQREDLREFHMQRLRGLDIAEQDNRGGAIPLDSGDEVAKAAVCVAAEPDVRHRCASKAP
jgi:hypothetical protein